MNDNIRVQMVLQVTITMVQNVLMIIAAKAQWSSWAAWGSCSTTCPGAVKSRTRTCTDVTQATRTGACAGQASEEAVCDITDSCPSK